jgi:hypothetical protein
MRTLVIAATVLAAACGRADPDKELRTLVDDMETAVEARDTAFFRGLIAASYRDDHGNDRERLINAIRGFFLTNPRIEAIVRIDDVRVNAPDSADIVLQVALVRGAGGPSLFGFGADFRAIELELVRDEDWYVIGAYWQ